MNYSNPHDPWETDPSLSLTRGKWVTHMSYLEWLDSWRALEMEKRISELDHQLTCMHILAIKREAKITEDVKGKLVWVWNHIEVIKQDVSAAALTPYVKKLEMEVSVIMTQLQELAMQKSSKGGALPGDHVELAAQITILQKKAKAQQEWR